MIRVLGSLAFLGWVASATAAVPDWLRAAAAASLPAYPEDTKAVVLFDQQETTVKENGEIKTRYRRAYKILRAEGREFATVHVCFDKETRLTYLKGWSLASQGKDFVSKEKDAVELSPFSFELYSDTRCKHLEMSPAEPGSVIGYEYDQKGRPMVFRDEWGFQLEVPVFRARYLLQLPPGWEFTPFWLNHGPVQPETAGANAWVWQLENIPAVEQEPAMPAWEGIVGRLGVTVFPREGNAAGKSHASWGDVGLWYSRLAADRRRTSPEIKQKVAELTRSAPSTLEKIQALARFVQGEIRYVAIEIGIGGYQPHPAADIFVNRYGDCKDKATLLSTMLREIGVESYYVLIHHRRGVVAPEFPTPLTFDHAILAIRVPPDVSTNNLYAVVEHSRLGRLLFFDPTDPLTPLGYLAPTLQANYGLVVTEDGGELVKLPLLSPTLNRLLRAVKLVLTPDGTLHGAVQEIRWGASAAEMRASFLNVPETERKKKLEDFLSSFLGNFVLQASVVDNLGDSGSNLVLEYSFLAKDYAKVAGDLLLVRPRVLGEKASDLMERKDRKYPVEFPATTLDTDAFEFTLPRGYQVDELPPPAKLSCDFAQYESKAEVAGNVLRYQRSYSIKDVMVPASHLEELKKFYRQISADERSTAVLKRAPAP